MEILYCYWHPVVKNGTFTFLLTSSGNYPRMVKNYFTLLLTSSATVKNGNLLTQWSRMLLLLTSSGQEWTSFTSHCYYWHSSGSRMALSIDTLAITHWHLVVKNGYFTLLLTSSGQVWQFHLATDIQWSRMAISHYFRHLVVKNEISYCNWYLVVKNGYFNCYTSLLLTSSGQEW